MLVFLSLYVLIFSTKTKLKWICRTVFSCWFFYCVVYCTHYFLQNVRRAPLAISAVSENRISEIEAHAALIKRDAPRLFLARDVAESIIWVACDDHGSDHFFTTSFPVTSFVTRSAVATWCRLGYFMKISEGGEDARVNASGVSNESEPREAENSLRLTRESVPFLLNLKYSPRYVKIRNMQLYVKSMLQRQLSNYSSSS